MKLFSYYIKKEYIHTYIYIYIYKIKKIKDDDDDQIIKIARKPELTTENDRWTQLDPNKYMRDSA